VVDLGSGGKLPDHPQPLSKFDWRAGGRDDWRMSLVEIWPVLGLGIRSPAMELFVPGQETLVEVARLAARGIGRN
jgi:hypothetical protein